MLGDGARWFRILTRLIAAWADHAPVIGSRSLVGNGRAPVTRRLGPLSGAASVVLILASFAAAGTAPKPDAPTSEVVSFYADHDTGQLVSACVLSLGALLFLVFIAVFSRTLRHEGGGVPWILCLSGGIVFVVGLTLFAGLTIALGDVASDIDPSALQALHVLNQEMFFTVTIGAAGFLLGAGAAVAAWSASPEMARMGGGRDRDRRGGAQSRARRCARPHRVRRSPRAGRLVAGRKCLLDTEATGRRCLSSRSRLRGVTQRPLGGRHLDAVAPLRHRPGCVSLPPPRHDRRRPRADRGTPLRRVRGLAATTRIEVLAAVLAFLALLSRQNDLRRDATPGHQVRLLRGRAAPSAQ